MRANEGEAIAGLISTADREGNQGGGVAREEVLSSWLQIPLVGFREVGKPTAQETLLGRLHSMERRDCFVQEFDEIRTKLLHGVGGKARHLFG